MEPPRVRVVVLVAFREQSHALLRTFVSRITEALQQGVGRDQWRLMVGVQTWDGRPFSRARVLNCLARIAHKTYPGARIVLHSLRCVPDARAAALYACEVTDPVTRIVSLCAHTASPLDISHVYGMSGATFMEAGGLPEDVDCETAQDEILRDAITVRAVESHRGASLQDLAPRLVHVPDAIVAGEVRLECIDPSPVTRMSDAAIRAARAAALESKYPTERLDAAFRVQQKWHRLQSPTCFFVLQLHVTLPPGWACKVSSQHARPYYYQLNDMRSTVFAPPEGTVITQTPPPLGHTLFEWNEAGKAAAVGLADYDGQDVISVPV